MRNVVYILEMHVSIGDESPTVVNDIVVTIYIFIRHPFLLLRRFHLSSVQFRNAANVQSVRLVPGYLQSKSPCGIAVFEWEHQSRANKLADVPLEITLQSC